MDACTCLRGRFGKVPEYWPRAPLLLLCAALNLITEANPSAFSLCLRIAFLDLLGVIGRISKTDENLPLKFHPAGGLMLFCQCLVRQSQPSGRSHVRASQRIGKVNVEPVPEFGSFTFECLGQSNMRNRVGTDENLKAVHVARHLCCARRHGPIAKTVTHLREPVFDRSNQIGAGANCRIEENNAVIGETDRPAEARLEKLAYEANLKLHHFARRVVDPVILTQLRIVGGQKILIKVKPNVRTCL